MADETEPTGFDTLRIHAGYDSQEHHWAVSPPIYQTAAFDLGDIDRARRLWTGAELGGVYTRVGNPTVEVLEHRIAELDGGSAALAVASGMAAVTYALLLLGEGGGNIVAAASLYGATEENLLHFLPKFGIETRFAQTHDAAGYAELIDARTRAVFLESISNPNAEIVDLEAIAAVAHAHGVPVVVDNSVATPYLFRPLDHGADIVVYSATKGLSGHGDVIAGVVVERAGFEYGPARFPQLHEQSYKLRGLDGAPRSPLEVAPDAAVTTALRAFYLEFIGAALSPFSAFLALQGLSTISERLQKQTATTQILVDHLAERPEVEWVRYPTAPGSTTRELAARDFPRGAGAVFSFGLAGGRDAVAAFISALRVFSYHVNLGDVRSLVANPAETTHAELDASAQALADLPPNLIRVSVGLEDPRDLVTDLDHGLTAAARIDSAPAAA